jgi:hypothetical protein
MSTTSIGGALRDLRGTQVWKSIFRRGPARTNRTRSQAIFGNVFLHLLPVRVRERSLRVRATYYLGSVSLLLFGLLLTVTGRSFATISIGSASDSGIRPTRGDFTSAPPRSTITLVLRRTNAFSGRHCGMAAG